MCIEICASTVFVLFHILFPYISLDRNQGDNYKLFAFCDGIIRICKPLTPIHLYHPGSKNSHRLRGKVRMVMYKPNKQG